MSTKAHWEGIYSTKADSVVSWTQTDPRVSLRLIKDVLPCGAVIDIGGGTSVLAERLLEAGYAVMVLDISEAALRRAQLRLGEKSAQVRWLAADVTTVADIGRFDLWHDRAVFHFLTRPEDRKKYVELAERSIPVGGHLIISTFALNGPKECSGLPVQRYDGTTLAEQFGGGFALKKEVAETHVTPRAKPQSFIYAILKRVSPASHKV